MDLTSLVQLLTSVLSVTLELINKLKEIIFNVIPQSSGLPPKIATLFTYLLVLSGLYAMFSAARTLFKIIIIIFTILLIVEVGIWIATGKSP